jgi:hypothetical protein
MDLEIVRWAGISTLILLVSAFSQSGCGANEGILRSGRESPLPSAAPMAVPFEKDLAAMKEVNFKWVFVLRRRDGLPMDAEDKAFVRDNAARTNRRVLAEQGRAIILGSNFDLGLESLKALNERFVLADYSPIGQDTPESNGK